MRIYKKNLNMKPFITPVEDIKSTTNISTLPSLNSTKNQSFYQELREQPAYQAGVFLRKSFDLVASKVSKTFSQKPEEKNNENPLPRGPLKIEMRTYKGIYPGPEIVFGVDDAHRLILVPSSCVVASNAKEHLWNLKAAIRSGINSVAEIFILPPNNVATCAANPMLDASNTIRACQASPDACIRNASSLTYLTSLGTLELDMQRVVSIANNVYNAHCPTSPSIG